MGRAPHRPQGDPLTQASPAPPAGEPAEQGPVAVTVIAAPPGVDGLRSAGLRPTGLRSTDPVSADVGELALRACAGDRRALEPLVRATYGDAYGLALRLVGDEHDARDTVQEAYTRALRGIRRFRGDAAFTTWLHRITANCAADLLARRSRGRHLHLDALDADGHPLLVDARAEHDPEGRSCDAAERDRLVAALGRLPDRLRRAVVLHDVYDLPHEAVAAELGISVAAARVRLHRGRRRLRDDLYGQGVDGDGLRGDGLSCDSLRGDGAGAEADRAG